MTQTEPRKSYLRTNAYVRKKGDFLDNFEQAYTLECVSTNHYVDPKTGTSVKYGLLVGFSQETPDTPLSLAYVEDDPTAFLGSRSERDAGGGIQQIRRTRPADGQQRVYRYSKEDGDYVFTPQN